MRQARRPSNAMLAKYTGWGTALGSPADENEVKRTAGCGRGNQFCKALNTIPVVWILQPPTDLFNDIHRSALSMEYVHDSLIRHPNQVDWQITGVPVTQYRWCRSTLR